MARSKSRPRASAAIDDGQVRRAIDGAPDVDIDGAAPSGPVSRPALIAAQVRYEAALQAVEEDRGALRDRRAELDERAAELDERASELDEDAAAARGRELGLDRRESAIADRERDFDNEFAQRRQAREAELEAALEPLKVQIDDLRRQRDELSSGLAEQRATALVQRTRMEDECEQQRADRVRAATEQADAILAAARERADAAFSATEARTLALRGQVGALEQTVREREHAILGREIAVKAREDETEGRERELDQLIEERAKLARADAENVAHIIASERDRLTTELSKAKDELAKERQARRRVESIDPDHHERLLSDNEELRRQLRAANPADAAELARLTAVNRELDERARRAASEAAQLNEALRAHRDLQEDVRDLTGERARALGQRDALRSEVDRLRDDLELLRGASETKSPDSELVAIDDEAEEMIAAGVPRLRHDPPKELSAIVDETRRAMATLRDPRFYDEHVVRCFVAGLAASQLHIVEGISGTGKTSLPIAFAAAIDAPVEVVEVQSVWRDRLDLVGHYSHLQRRYYSTPFARAVYRSATEPGRKVPMFIVLDEMNLSHPEQYLADVLSALERTGRRQELELLQSDGRAAQLRDGRRVALGRHVWFIGTANRDETTKTIADKTYDRAHIMELPTAFEPQTGAERPKSQGALPVAHLHKLFAEAAKSKKADAAWATECVINDAIGAQLHRWSLGTGSRLRRQIDRFVPVYTASGGDRLLALDHLMATKIVRKLDMVFDIRQEHIAELAQVIRAAAGVEDLAQLPATERELERQRSRAED